MSQAGGDERVRSPSHAVSRWRVVLAALAATVVVSSCGGDSPTGTSPLSEPTVTAGRRTGAPPSSDLVLGPFASALDEPVDLSCENVEIVRVRFGKPGWVRANQVGLYVFFRGIPTEARTRLRVWWDYDDEWGEYEDIFLEIGTDAFEQVLEHEYEEVFEPTEKLVRVSLIVDELTGECARNRWVVLRPAAATGTGGGGGGPVTQTANVGPASSAVGTPFLAFFTSEGVRFTVSTPLTIDSVSIEPSAAGTVVVNLVSLPSGTTIASTSAVVPGPGAQRIPIGFSVPTGNYVLCMQGSTPGPPFFGMMANQGAAYPYSIPGVISLTDTALGLGGFPPFNYFYFYDWQVTW